jgi:peptidoglycan/LPS O-acetylase OafA/YrhL
VNATSANPPEVLGVEFGQTCANDASRKYRNYDLCKELGSYSTFSLSSTITAAYYMERLGGRDKALDGLRAFAVGLVIIRHLFDRKFPGAFIGVDLFFALSGYLITSILVSEFEARGDISFRHFYIRRCARLMPALALLLVAAIVVVELMPHHPFRFREVVFAGTYTMNWARALNLGDSGILGHTWSLACEEQFYLLWPPILLLTLKHRPNWAGGVAVALACASTMWGAGLAVTGVPYARTYNGFDSRAVELLIGCAAAFLPLQGRLAAALARFWFLPVIALVVFALRGHESWKGLPYGGYAALGMLSAWLIIAIRRRAAPIFVLQQPVIVYIGSISYGIYLWHYLILGVISSLGFSHTAQVVAVIVTSPIIAGISYSFVEAPILRATRDKLTTARRPNLTGGMIDEA